MESWGGTEKLRWCALPEALPLSITLSYSASGAVRNLTLIVVSTQWHKGRERAAFCRPPPHSFSLFLPQVLVQAPALVYSLGGEGDVEPDAEYGESGRVLNWP